MPLSIAEKIINKLLDQAAELAEKNASFGIIWNLLRLPIALTIFALLFASSFALFKEGYNIFGIIVGGIALFALLFVKEYIVKIWSNLKKLYCSFKSKRH